MADKPTHCETRRDPEAFTRCLVPNCVHCVRDENAAVSRHSRKQHAVPMCECRVCLGRRCGRVEGVTDRPRPPRWTGGRAGKTLVAAWRWLAGG